ncbi:cell division protein CrgA [Thermobifida halotolerans]|uniref:Cell division protein CrgA n=1 Tax=Thermobifida halotolerans TaxID=483545 RepID=A0A399FWC5_9ACTN|nr:cell division protein CrgA [Thermobifida halotolerans]UOE18933.1 cell division protein CrgA [Thermobifida halotolerans]
MPKSRSVRKKKAVYTPPPTAPQPKIGGRWVAPVMVAFGVLGILWIGVYYLIGNFVPVSFLENQPNWNLAIGFSGIILALIVSTRWR